MKKRNLLLIAISLISLLFAVLGVTAFAGEDSTEPTPSLDINGANVSFESTVHLLYSVGYENIDNPENIKLLIWRYKDGINIADCVLGTEDASLSPIKGELNEGSVWGKVFNYDGIAAAEMTENIYARAYVEQDGKIVYSDVVKYSVLQYAYNKLGLTGNSPSENKNLRAMLTKMLEYGATAQTYFFEDKAGPLATDPFYEIKVEGATLPDGTSKGLYAAGEELTLTRNDTTADLPYVRWTDASGRQVSAKESYTFKVSGKVELTATLTDELSAFGEYDHVVVIGLDGAGGQFFKDANTPNFDRIFANGAVTYNMRVTSPSISAPSWMSFLHGVNPEHHGIINNTVVETTPYDPASRYPSFLRVILEDDPTAKVASFATWSGINTGIVEDGIGIYKVKGSDASGVTATVNYINENKDFSAIFLHLNDPDSCGHSYGYGLEKHLAELESVDVQINTVYQALVDAGIADKTLFIVTTDHGGRNETNSQGVTSGTHGGLTDNEKYVVFAAVGGSVKAGVEEIKGLEMRDGAAIVLYALGIPQPATYTATIPEGLFEGVKAVERPVYHTPEDDRDVVPSATPEKNTDGYITSFVKKDLVTYLPFDESLDEVASGATVTGNGTVVYEDGYYGKAVKLDDGYVTLEGFDPGTDSFTIAMWVKLPCVYGDAPIIANKGWGGRERGFVFAGVRSTTHYSQLNLADGNSRIDLNSDLPADYNTGWMHVIIIFDRERDTVSYCYDFGELISTEMRGDRDTDLVTQSLSNSYGILNIGQDATGNYKVKCGLSVDEFMIFDGAFTRTDINSLVKYFDKDVVVKTLDDVVDKEIDIFFDFNGNTENSGNAALPAVGTNTAYEEGLLGSALNFEGTSDGKASVAVDGYLLGTESFSLSFWLKCHDDMASDPIIFGTQDWNNGKSQGITVALLKNGNVRVNHADGTNRFSSGSTESVIPGEFVNQWVHVAVVFDRENNQYKISFNFGEFIVFAIPEALQGVSCDSVSGKIMLGDDYDGYNPILHATLDEFAVFKGALDKDDLAAIKAYYDELLAQ